MISSIQLTHLHEICNDIQEVKEVTPILRIHLRTSDQTVAVRLDPVARCRNL